MLNGLDLFSGIGGITLALQQWVKPVAYCECDKFAQGILLSRMADGSLPCAPIWDDITTLHSTDLPSIDIIYGGFPCQDVSLAGLKKGLDGKRTGLFYQAIRLISECNPEFVFIENVPGIRKHVHSIRIKLEALGYDCRDGFLSAAEVGARHIRNRWFLLAYSNGMRQLQSQRSKFDKRRRASDGSKDSAEPCKSSWWSTEPDVGRVAHGVLARVDRLKCLGNSVVPQCAKKAFEILMGL